MAVHVKAVDICFSPLGTRVIQHHFIAKLLSRMPGRVSSKVNSYLTRNLSRLRKKRSDSTISNSVSSIYMNTDSLIHRPFK